MSKKKQRNTFKNRERLAGFFGSRGSRTAKSRGKSQPVSGPTPVAARVFSARWLATLAVLIIGVLAASGTISRYFNQSAEMASVQESISSLQDENNDLKQQQSWWKDDNYVKQQAKGRLFYVNEGETPYVVVGTDFTSGIPDETSADAMTAPEDSWTKKLWDSFQMSAVNGNPVGAQQQGTDQQGAEQKSTDQSTAGASASATESAPGAP
ncbi:septum formation initiator family protein [Rothia terrae]|uniref:FtsB family cell division protein n=1 Tax=Rothia terrae TaxID=396015 RepID=UPI001444F613|nr:septum formation initiator family protein [Rothia terrae]NKZ34286.1 septum formation initiator family protein [Rothia terrae]